MLHPQCCDRYNSGCLHAEAWNLGVFEQVRRIETNNTYNNNADNQ